MPATARRLAAGAAFLLALGAALPASAEPLSPEAGNYFVEALLEGGLSESIQEYAEWRACDGVGTLVSHRFATAPVIYFETGAGTPSETDMRALFDVEIPRLTGLTPTYWTGAVPTPEERPHLFIVQITGNHVDFFFDGPTVTGVVLHTPAGTNGMDAAERPQVLHRLAHALSGYNNHWYTNLAAVLGVHDTDPHGTGATDFHPAEIAAFQALYSRPAGTPLSGFADVVPESADVFNAAPVLYRAELVLPDYPASAADPATWNHGVAGQDVFLIGARLSVALQTLFAGSSAPFNVPPVVSFNGVEVVPNVDFDYQNPPAELNGAEARALRVTIPPGASSGPMSLWTRNQTTSPVGFTTDGVVFAGVPGEPTGLTHLVPVGADVTLQWTPPATYLDGAPFGTAGSTAHILRDGVEIGTQGGELTSFLDATPGAGRSSHLYQVQYEAGGVLGAPSDAFAFRVPGDVDFPEAPPGARCPAVAGGLAGPLCPATTAPFTDIGTSFARESIECVYARKISAGTGPTTFSPGDIVTRGQMAIFLMTTYEAVRGMPYIDPLRGGFNDIDGHYAETRILQLATLGITSGTSEHMFSPDAPVTREQMAVFLMNLWEEIAGRPYDGPVVTTFGDIGGSFAVTRIQQLLGLGITSGTAPGVYSPAQPVSRDQMATFLVNLMEVFA